MKNLFKSLALAAAVGLSSVAMADGTSYLYWMLDDTSTSAPFENWTYAMVKVIGADSAETSAALTYLFSADNGSVSKFGIESDTAGYGYIDRTLVTVGSQYLSDSYKFIVELYNSGDNLLGFSNSILGGSINAGDTRSGLIVNEFGSAHIPEPTSGMLALLGFGLLALRRKQK